VTRQPRRNPLSHQFDLGLAVGIHSRTAHHCAFHSDFVLVEDMHPYRPASRSCSARVGGRGRLYQAVRSGLCRLPGRACIGLEGHFDLMPRAFVSFLKAKALKVSGEVAP
jgi:hypothetical protein